MKMKTVKLAGWLVVWFIVQSCKYDDLPGCDPTITLQIVRREPSDCAVPSGLIEVSVSGGDGFRFRLNDNSPQNEPIFSNLSAGNYTVTAISGPCEYAVTASVENQNGFQVDVARTPSGCQTSNGSLTVSAIGGTPPFMYQLNGDSFQQSNVFSNLANGNYLVLTRDATGCDFSLTATIPSGVDFSSVSQIVQNNCAVSQCHNGSQFPKLTTYSEIQENASRIRTQVSSRRMPPLARSPLTQQQIDAIICWIDDGALPPGSNKLVESFHLCFFPFCSGFIQSGRRQAQ
ncbi:MAG TPA: hypothetical protein VFU05_08850 [Cyclobacteriaceae bacterium]|nr:hypothetical protein [Cyclobacteriaceae bacterium]